jgi:chloramphenicol 3-O-phosphotransferase
MIIVLTGIQGAGKSTIGPLLAARFERAAYIDADVLQGMIVAGSEWVTDAVTAGEPPAGDAADQLRLRLENACLLARSFAGNGITAIIGDIILGSRWDDLRTALRGVSFYLVILAPDVETVIARDARRSRPVGAEWAYYLDAELRGTMSGIGVWVDSSKKTPDETTDEIVRRMDEGLIGSSTI